MVVRVRYHGVDRVWQPRADLMDVSEHGGSMFEGTELAATTSYETPTSLVQFAGGKVNDRSHSIFGFGTFSYPCGLRGLRRQVSSATM